MIKKILFTLTVLLLLSACGGGGSSVTSADVAQAFKDAGLEVENTRAMTKDDYGIVPYIGEGTRFFIPSLCEDCGGRIIVTENNADAQKIGDVYIAMGEESALFFSWAFVHNNIVVQINGDLDEETARKYEATLNDL